MNPEDLLSTWDELTVPDAPGRLEAFGVPDRPGTWIAVDHARTRHLLVEVPDGTVAPAVTTKGLSTAVARHRVAGRAADFVDLACLEDATGDTFAVVVADIVKDLDSVRPADRLAAVVDTLARWRWFWGVAPDGMSENDALGLFAELWFLDQWVGVSPESVTAWTGSQGARHDFQWPAISVEVKATSRRNEGTVTHTIQHLDQLADAETGQLYLFSLRTVRDQLAANTLPGMVARCSEHLRTSVAAREEFLRKVSARGYSPANERRLSASYRILEERLYVVTDGFPRLTTDSFSSGLPMGVGDVTYRLDLAACEPWLRATRPDEWPPNG